VETRQLEEYTQADGITAIMDGISAVRMLGYVSPRHGVDMSPMNWLIDFKDTSLHLAVDANSAEE
jgi:hypothetical protein